VEFLGKILLGQRIRTGPQAGPGKPAYSYPSLEQRLRAAELLLKKVLPDLAANELTAKDGEPLIPNPVSDLDLARWVAFVLASGQRQLDQQGEPAKSAMPIEPPKVGASTCATLT
jgi:hypothetical protein